jgi:hypothetical protein
MHPGDAKKLTKTTKEKSDATPASARTIIGSLRQEVKVLVALRRQRGAHETNQ